MQVDYATHMRAAVQETFGEVCFLDCVPTTQRLADGISQVIFIRILDPFQGFLELLLPLELKKVIVENVRGEEWAKVPLQKIDDTFLELVNILAGKFLASLTGNDRSYRIGLPEIHYEQHTAAVDQRVEVFHYEVEGMLAGVRLVHQKEGA